MIKSCLKVFYNETRFPNYANLYFFNTLFLELFSAGGKSHFLHQLFYNNKNTFR